MIKRVTAKISNTDLKAYNQGTDHGRTQIVKGIFENLNNSEICYLLSGFSNNEEFHVTDVAMGDSTSGTIFVDFTGSANSRTVFDKDNLSCESVVFKVFPNKARIRFTSKSTDFVGTSPSEEL